MLDYSSIKINVNIINNTFDLTQCRLQLDSASGSVPVVYYKNFQYTVHCQGINQ